MSGLSRDPHSSGQKCAPGRAELDAGYYERECYRIAGEANAQIDRINEAHDRVHSARNALLAMRAKDFAALHAAAKAVLDTRPAQVDGVIVHGLVQIDKLRALNSIIYGSGQQE